jgi:hypothetical protein
MDLRRGRFVRDAAVTIGTLRDSFLRKTGLAGIRLMAMREQIGIEDHNAAPVRVVRPPRAGSDGSCALRNWQHENFAQEIARLSEQAALGKDGEDAYVSAGFARHRRNHVRLMGRQRVAKRIEWLRFEREARAQAARMSPVKVIEELHARGIERFEDLIDRNAAGVVTLRDYAPCLPVEIGIAALKMVHGAFGIKTPIGG